MIIVEILENTFKFKRNINMPPPINNLSNILAYYISILFSWALKHTWTYTERHNYVHKVF